MQLPSSPSSPGVLVRPETGLTDPLDYDRYPAGSRVDVWWPGERQWFTAKVTETRTEVHTVKRTKVLCREIFCVYELDDHEQWHSLHNNKVRLCSSTHENDAEGVHTPHLSLTLKPPLTIPRATQPPLTELKISDHHCPN